MKSFKEFIVEADMLSVKKRLKGGHTGHFYVSQGGLMTLKIVPKGKRYNEVDWGHKFTPEELPRSATLQWARHLKNKVLPRAKRLADTVGKGLGGEGYNEKLDNQYQKMAPSWMRRVSKKGGGGVVYDSKRKLHLRALPDAASWVMRQGAEELRRHASHKTFLVKHKIKKLLGKAPSEYVYHDDYEQ